MQNDSLGVAVDLEVQLLPESWKVNDWRLAPAGFLCNGGQNVLMAVFREKTFFFFLFIPFHNS